MVPITAGTTASNANDGSVQTTSGNDSRTGSRRASVSARRRRAACAWSDKLSSSGAEREAIALGGGDAVGDRSGGGAELVDQRRERLAEALTALEPVGGRRESGAGRDRRPLGRLEHRLRG